MGPPEFPHERLDPTGMLFNGAAAASGFPVDGLRFISDALAYAPRLVANGKPGEHIKGQALCAAIAAYAREQFGEEAFSVLADWGLKKGEDVGRAVVTLVEHGLMHSSNEDSLADFQGLTAC